MGKLLPSGPIPSPPPKRRKKVNPFRTKNIARKEHQNRLINKKSNKKSQNFRVVT